MKRRGFLASLVGLLALKKMPMELKASPVVAPAPITPSVGITSGTVTTCDIQINGCTWVRAEDDDTPWSYTNGTTGATLTFG